MRCEKHVASEVSEAGHVYCRLCFMRLQLADDTTVRKADRRAVLRMRIFEYDDSRSPTLREDY